MKFDRERLSAPRQRFPWPSILGSLLLCFTSHAAAQAIITLSGNGTLSWTNSLVNGTYEVQWSPALTAGGTWTNDWSQLQNLQGTQSVFNVSVPMFYRVKGTAYPETTDSTACYLNLKPAVG